MGSNQSYREPVTFGKQAVLQGTSYIWEATSPIGNQFLMGGTGQEEGLAPAAELTHVVDERSATV
jgi:hypothetical protein